MDYIRRIPFILGSIMAIITGIISLNCNISIKQVYLRMIISLVLFFIVGVFLRNTISEIEKDIKTKSIEKAKNEEETGNIEDIENTERNQEAVSGRNNSAPTVDYLIDDDDDDFKPLNVKEVISTKK